MTEHRLLLVEDDLSLGQTLQELLELQSYQVRWSKTISQAREAVKTEKFDLIILDLGLPDGSGFGFAKEVKKSRKAPFIFITANATALNRLEGFEIGAEEFIPKPFHLKEIFLRIKHVLETHAEKRILKIDGQTIDFESMAVTQTNGQVEYLPVRDFGLLELLIRASPRVVSRDDILNTLWGDEKFPSNRTVDNMVVRLRGLFLKEYIRSVRGIGYQWVATGEKDG